MHRGRYVFFWDGYLSQWYPAEFEIDGIKFNCAEQYMMYRKAKFFGDEKRKQLILEAVSPYLQKRLGRQVENFDEEKWKAVARDVVFEGNRAKFSQNQDLLKYLLSTNDKIIVEASPYDKIWGCGLTASDPRIYDPKNWTGTNWLGEVLMKVRTVLRNKKDHGYFRVD